MHRWLILFVVAADVVVARSRISWGRAWGKPEVAMLAMASSEKRRHW